MRRRAVGLRSRMTGRLTTAGAGLRTWGRWRWTAAITSALATVLVVALPTAMIANPVFGREVPTTAWAWPALLALGYTGAIQWFTPVQPWLAVGAVVLLGWALVRRLGSQEACAVPVR